jgi:hypothetical protein
MTPICCISWNGSGAGFRSLTEAVGTTTPAGRMMMQMLDFHTQNVEARSPTRDGRRLKPNPEGIENNQWQWHLARSAFPPTA